MLKGVSASPGFIVGPAFLVQGEEDHYIERDIEAHEIPREIERFEEALLATRDQIRQVQRRVGEALGQEHAGIFEAHLMVVDDQSFLDEVDRGLKTHLLNVETVVQMVAERYAEALSRVEDDYLRERAADVRDVARRILRNLSGHKGATLAGIEEPSVVLANDLAPSDTAVMDRRLALGLATDLGSRTSHTAIMARALGIPAVVGLHDVSTRVAQGDRVLLDGSKGLLVIHPSAERLRSYADREVAQQVLQAELAGLRDVPAETRDGYQVVLSANIELPGDVEAVLEHGCEGVGLFRSEFLYMAADHLPTEAEQERAYAAVAARLAPAPVIIRTLDLGGDKLTSHVQSPQESNPFMGWRAIRFCLAHPEIFKVQLRAILRASIHANVRMMYPMISRIEEVRAAHALLAECKDELRAEGIAFNEEIEVGVMIEVPSAALTARLLAPLVHFFSLGTNDLVQYTLAVDRVNEHIASLYQPTHPAIVHLVREVIEVSHQHGIWTGICGEMAGNPVLAPLLLGLGADELSVSPAAAPLVKKVLRGLHFSQAEALAEAALAAVEAEEVQQACHELVAGVAPDVLAFLE
ncbi:MAG: phosphoenolpyruvate--protein phosphotransferase [Candidatus Marinimicrobia bacterium]|nr:phosphoenolpyruvate--protein phosphotransferase [Candidatus Neomarinimicrobiota bacterium]